ncbi:MAG: putative Ig domain-containing protein [Acidobacteriota bacterium]|nr:putative Ig domain-containing protein [Acidobacteriota bacterium]
MNFMQSQVRHIGVALFTLLVLFALAALPNRQQVEVSAAQCPPIAVAPGSIPGGALGVTYSKTFTASGGQSPYTFSRSAGALPPGLFLNSGGGLGGTPTATGNYNFTIQARDANGCTGTRSYSMLVVCPSITLTNNLPGASLGVQYSQTISASGGDSPYTFSKTAGTIPPGLFLNSGGGLNGTPTALGNYNFTIQATDSNGCTGSRSYSILVVCPNITLNPASLPAATRGVAYSQNITASGGDSPYTYSLVSGSIPPGMFLGSNGSIGGTSNVTGTYSFLVRATDNNGCTGQRAYTVTVNCPNFLIFPANVPGATIGVPYSQNFTTTGGQSPYAYSLASGTLPPGMLLGSGGAFGGTPNTVGTYTFTLRSTDANGCADTRSYTINVSCPDIAVNPTTLAGGQVGELYSQTLTASGGQSPYTYLLFIGSLPSGLFLSANGTITGTPTAAGSYGFSIRARDNNNCFGLRAYTVVIAPACSTITLNPATLPNGSTGVPYSQTVTPSGGQSPYSFSIISGGLPAGLTLSPSTGVISGTPTSTMGNASFTVRATDANGCSGQRAYTIQTTCPTINIATNNINATVGASFLQTIFANGQTSPFTFSFAPPSAPAWLNISTTGVLTGTPPAAGGYSFGVKATDANGCSNIKTITVTATCPTITINPTTLPAGTVGATYSQVFSASGGTAPYLFGTQASALPPGLTLNTNGTLSGTPTTAGSYSFIIRGNDANGCFGERSYTLVINPLTCPTITINPATLPNGTAGAAYSQTLSGTGGTAPYEFNLFSGTLPTGLTLTSAGLLSGTPTTPGSFNFIVRTRDANGCIGARNYTVVANCPTITINPPGILSGRVGEAYSWSFNATGGQPPYTYSVSGALPAGLAFSPPNTISGTPTAAGSFNITARTTDANGCIGERNYTLIVNNQACPTITINPATLPNGIVGATYNQTLSATGGTAAYAFSITTGALPNGLSLSTSGALTGTPTSAGSYNFRAKATDASGCTGERDYTVVINNAACPTITVNPINSTLPTATVGVAYSQTFTGSGGISPYKFRGNGNVPPGLTPTQSGNLSGTPTAPGSYTFTVIAEDANGCTGERNYTLVVNAAACPTITINQTGLPPGIVGAVYNQTLTVTGGTSPYTFAVSSGSFPAELMLNSTNGAILGTLATAGTYNFTVRVTDINGCVGDRTFTLVISANLVTSVSAASFIAGGTLAPESIVATFGTNLATTIQVATTTTLPTELGGCSMKIKDSAGVERLAPLFFVSPTQINHQMPAGTALGTAVVTVLNGVNIVATGSVEITNVSPGVFSADASGRGLASAVALRVRSNGLQSFEPVVRYDSALGKFVAEPIDVSNPLDQVFLVFYGTGWKLRSGLASVSCTIGGVTSEVLYAGEVPGFVGYDQLNAKLSPSLAGLGEVDVVITVDGKTANTLRVAFR